MRVHPGNGGNDVGARVRRATRGVRGIPGVTVGDDEGRRGGIRGRDGRRPDELERVGGAVVDGVGPVGEAGGERRGG